MSETRPRSSLDAEVAGGVRSLPRGGDGRAHRGVRPPGRPVLRGGCGSGAGGLGAGDRQRDPGGAPGRCRAPGPAAVGQRRRGGEHRGGPDPGPAGRGAAGPARTGGRPCRRRDRARDRRACAAVTRRPQAAPSHGRAAGPRTGPGTVRTRPAAGAQRRAPGTRTGGPARGTVRRPGRQRGPVRGLGLGSAGGGVAAARTAWPRETLHSVPLFALHAAALAGTARPTDRPDSACW